MIVIRDIALTLERVKIGETQNTDLQIYRMSTKQCLVWGRLASSNKPRQPTSADFRTANFVTMARSPLQWSGLPYQVTRRDLQHQKSYVNNIHRVFYRQLDFSFEPGVANEILEKEPKSCQTVA